MAEHTLSTRLMHALLRIQSQSPRLIVSPPTNAPRRASVAIIVRVRENGIRSNSYAHQPPNFPLNADAASSHESPSTLLNGIDPATLPTTMDSSNIAQTDTPTQIRDFFEQTWVKEGAPEILFIKRATRASDRWSAHVAFPGGRRDPDDENAQFTALRETWEEVGLDLCERSYVPVGQLDDREITTSLGKRLLMVLSPFVYLHTGRDAPMPELQTSEVASAHWIPLSWLHSPQVRWGDVKIDLGSRLAPKNWLMRNFMQFLIGNMHFRCILLNNEPVVASENDVSREVDDAGYEAPLPDLRLWGLTLSMSLDLISYMSPLGNNRGNSVPVIHPSPAAYPFMEPVTPTSAGDAVPVRPKPRRVRTGSSIFGTTLPKEAVQRAPSMASVFPRFEGADLNFWLWIFSWRYRRLMRDWTSSDTGQNDRRVNWAGMTLSSFYAALRRALVVAVVLRAAIVAGGVGSLAVWTFRKAKATQRRVQL